MQAKHIQWARAPSSLIGNFIDNHSISRYNQNNWNETWMLMIIEYKIWAPPFIHIQTGGDKSRIWKLRHGFISAAAIERAPSSWNLVAALIFVEWVRSPPRLIFDKPHTTCEKSLFLLLLFIDNLACANEAGYQMFWLQLTCIWLVLNATL